VFCPVNFVIDFIFQKTAKGQTMSMSTCVIVKPSADSKNTTTVEPAADNKGTAAAENKRAAARKEIEREVTHLRAQLKAATTPRDPKMMYDCAYIDVNKISERLDMLEKMLALTA
jgi:hypothetical protein